jgi:hypothetical protein
VFSGVIEIGEAALADPRALTNPLIIGGNIIFFKASDNLVIGHPTFGKRTTGADNRGSVFHGGFRPPKGGVTGGGDERLPEMLWW